MRIGIFTPKIQQAEMNVGRTAIFFQMNEERLNNKLVRCNKQKIETSNKSSVQAVSGSDQSNIEGLTFDVIILDEAQKITNYTWSERIVPMGGGCIIGSSLITLPSGEMISIQELVEKQEQKTIMALDTTTFKLIEAPIEDYHNTGIHPTLKITLDSGRTLQGTFDHPIIIKPRDTRTPKWERLENLKIGMQVAVPRELPFFGKYLNPHARITGMLIGDGTYGDRQNVGYSSADEELWDYIKDNYPDLKINIYESYITEDGRLFEGGTICGMSTILREAGIYGQVKCNKRLPDNLSSYTKESLAELIGGLFDTDGGVYIEDNRKIMLSFTQNSYEIIKDLQLALLKFGIHSKIQTRKIKKIKFKSAVEKYYVLNIRGKENIENFAKNIKFITKKKQLELERGVELLKNHKYKIQKDLLDSDLRFEKIKLIENAGEQSVYDLTITGVHNFIANGIYTHNTNAKMIKIGTPKTRNHFYDSVEGQASSEWYSIRKDWTECPQLWVLDPIYLPDHNDPTHEIIRPYSRYVFNLMPKSLKQELFPTRPELWSEGEMSVEDFKTQYMLQFIDGAGQFLLSAEWDKLVDGNFEWITHGMIGEKYVAGIDFAGSESEGADFTHISVLRIAPNGQKQKVWGTELHGTSYPDQMRYIAKLFGGPTPIFNVSSIFADYTGCGAPVVQTLKMEYGLTQLHGIIFNASDTYTNSGMNMKNIMCSQFKHELSYDRFKYPSKDLFLKSAGSDMNGFYHKMVGEWKDLESETRMGINKIIMAPQGGHDDCCMADVLANFSAIYGFSRQMPRASSGKMFNRGA